MKIQLLFLLSFAVLATSCSQKAAQFEVQYPSRLTVSRDVQKVYIRKDLIDARQDRLDLKEQVLVHLANELKKNGRYQVNFVEKENMKNLLKEGETAAIILGEIISGGEIERGQFTDIATCKEGVGAATSAFSAGIGEEVTTMGKFGGICRKGNLKSNLAEAGLGAALSFAGVNNAPPKNQVVRKYRYKNFSLFAQVDFRLFTIGTSQELLAVRADASSFGEQEIDRSSYKNVKETHDVASWLIGVFPDGNVGNYALNENEGMARGSNLSLEEVFYNQPLPVPDKFTIPTQRKDEIVKQLIQKTLQSFVRTISPYKVTVEADVASGGDSQAAEWLREGEAMEARKQLEDISENQRDAGDWYNLGLAYEATATSVEDYEDARRFYQRALALEEGNSLYAQGIGRTEVVLKNAKKLAQQISNQK